ncbi:hypothetical protein K490DRAFT_60410 [Saccharata proteae CBS 121410]|uniref:Uncharacterized protein n=1 Tax=Saccharata proteae CBS 121410 TaxID=1314787 RepID=A0A9P4LVZ9_9PEZI|nr:hypothetical protein K490DRAFT_60410 [Saccharata proteae CBS 121410]
MNPTARAFAIVGGFVAAIAFLAILGGCVSRCMKRRKYHSQRAHADRYEHRRRQNERHRFGARERDLELGEGWTNIDLHEMPKAPKAARTAVPGVTFPMTGAQGRTPSAWERPVRLPQPAISRQWFVKANVKSNNFGIMSEVFIAS